MTPVDQVDRDAVREEHGRSIFIEAGAGTGKTTAIVGRVVAMVARGTTHLRSVAAITFTEAAATELRDRIRDGLEKVANGVHEAITDPAARARCARALEQIDEAALTTLHGFAQRILAEHPLEAGLPPGFEVLDEIQARVEFEQAWGSFVDALYDDPELAPVLRRGLALGTAPESFHPVARVLHENHDRLPAVTAPPGAPPPLDAAPVRAALDELFALRGACRDETDRLAVRIDSLRTFHDLLGRARDDLDLIDVLLGADPARCSNGRAPVWSVDVKEVRAATGRVDDAKQALLDGQRRAVIDALLPRVVRFVADQAQRRRRAGTLEFHDLLVFARDLLRRSPDVRAALADRYHHLLLDEFQDTDPIQIELGVLLATDATDAGGRPWTDVSPRPGGLVVVGDPKQSIYRFRRADLAVYHDAQHRLGLEPRVLRESFRSVPDVLDFVNHLFSRLFVEEEGMQAAHVELHPARAPLNDDVAVRVFGRGVDGRVREARASEAADVAAVVQRIVGEGWLVEDPRTREVRAARLQDIALLIPSRTVLPGLEDAFEAADVPVRVESQSLVFSTAEVRDLVAALAAVDDPTDEVAIVAALRSPAFGCSDAELVEFARAGGRWDYRRDAPDPLASDHRVVAGLAALHSYWRDRWWRSVSETAEAIVRERRVLELTLARRRPRDHQRRIRFLLDQARAWDDAGGASLRGFVQWAQQQADERARVMESVAPERDHDAIRILTVHGAKGLEFPIVVLAGLNVAPTNDARAVIWTPAGPEIRVGKGDAVITTEGYEDARQVESRHDDAERLRLLYVAMTRARDHLVVSLHHSTRTRCHAQRIDEHLGGAPCVVLEPGSAAARKRSKRPGPVPESADLARRAAWLEEHDRVLADAGRPVSVSATTLAKAAAGEGGAADDPALEKEDEAPVAPWRRGRAGTAVGRAVHAVLQTVDLATGAGVEATARAQALAEGVADREDEVRALVESVLAAPVVRSAVADGARCWREVPVAADVDGILVEGFVDLLVETSDGFVVVDYKTDAAPGEADLDRALARYTPQGAAYALALGQALGRPVTRCVFVFARPGAAVEREVADLPAAVDRVRAGLAPALDAPAPA